MKIKAWDIAVYFKNQSNQIEVEQIDREYPQEHTVWEECIRLLQTDYVDLVVLNRAPAPVADAALRGIPMVIKNRRLHLEFLLKVSQQAEDFRAMANEYTDIYWRSKSLAEDDRYALQRRLVFPDSELKALDEFANFTWQDYQSKDKERRQLERTIENIMNAVIDCAKIVLASRKRPMPSTYREVIRLTGSIEGFSQDVSERLSEWTELRNILAHEYFDIRWQPIENFIKNASDVLQSFIESVKKFSSALLL